MTQFKEEVFARELQRTLSDRLARTLPDEFTVELSIFGVHSHCVARSRSRRCHVGRFESGEYHIDFGSQPAPKSRFDTLASGRTTSEAEVLDAVSAWLGCAALHDLYAAFAFVDRPRRALERLEVLLLRLRPGLRSLTHELQHEVLDYLWFKSPQRSCRVSFYGKNEHPDALFHWDECELFAFRVTEPELLAAVLERWLCDGAPPSALRREFPWLEIGKLADFYEAGKPLEGEFLESWGWIEGFYEDHPQRDAVLQFIEALRDEGYDSVLRAGQSMWSFIVSRSRRHGLRQGQPHIVFDFVGEELVMRIWDSARPVRLPRAELTPQVDAALRRLAETAID